MSEHFRSYNVVRIPLSRRERRRVRRMFAPVAPRSSITKTRVGIVIAAAICAGLAVGLEGPRASNPTVSATSDKPILWNDTQAVPTATVMPEDAAWAARAASRGPYDGSISPVDAARSTHIPYFGYCHVGGGTNCVVDGDTFYHGRDKIRIANIDAPETHPPRCTAEARVGKAATNRLRDLLNSGELSLASIDRDQDVFGRKLRNVAVSGADVGDTLVGEGLARPYAGGRRPWC